MYHKIKGIVIKEENKGENGKLLTVLSETDGVIYVNAKGARKISASYLKSAQLFAFSNMLLYKKNNFYTLSEAVLLEDFYTLRDDIAAFALACYCCEAAGVAATRDEDNIYGLKLLLNTLYAASKAFLPLKQIKAVFEMRLAHILGFSPELITCPVCGKENAKTEKLFFNIPDGRAGCYGCVGGAEISASVYDSIKFIVSAADTKIFSFSVGGGLGGLSDFCEEYFLTHTGQEYKSLDFLKKVL